MELLPQPKHFPTIKEMVEWLWPAVEALPYGTLISYAEFIAVLTVDPQANRRGRQAILIVRQKLLKERDKLLVNRLNVGYEIVRPEEHVGQSKRARRGAIRRMQQSVLIMTHAAFDLIQTEKEKVEFIHEQVRSALALALTHRVSRRKVLPPRSQIALPSGRELLRLLTRMPPPPEEPPKAKEEA